MNSSTKKKISIFPGLSLPGEPVCHDAAIQEGAYLSNQMILHSELQELLEKGSYFCMSLIKVNDTLHFMCIYYV